MAQLLVRIELEGTRDHEAYVILDTYMSSKFWSRVKRPAGETEPADALYQASTFGDHPNLATMANDLKRNIEFQVGEKARVLMVQSLGWTETA